MNNKLIVKGMPFGVPFTILEQINIFPKLSSKMNKPLSQKTKYKQAITINKQQIIIKYFLKTILTVLIFVSKFIISVILSSLKSSECI